MNVLERLVVPAALRGLAATWRFVEWDEHGRRGPRRDRIDPIVVALWHSDLLMLAVGYAPLGLAAMVSRHRDGDLAAAALEALGGTAVRGSSSRGGSEALRAMVELGDTGLPFAITTDGPRGPARRSKAGVVKLAARTNRPIVPAAARPEAGWRLSSWDRFIVPRPFTRVHVAVGSPILVPGEPTEGEFEDCLRRVDGALAELSDRSAEYAGWNEETRGDDA